ncbi:MAG: hypothetical protein ACOC4M_13240 [Promethearchaeia archaeon]
MLLRRSPTPPKKIRCLGSGTNTKRQENLRRNVIEKLMLKDYLEELNESTLASGLKLSLLPSDKKTKRKPVSEF